LDLRLRKEAGGQLNLETTHFYSVAQNYTYSYLLSTGCRVHFLGDPEKFYDKNLLFEL
jgi:hypothetical protein